MEAAGSQRRMAGLCEAPPCESPIAELLIGLVRGWRRGKPTQSPFKPLLGGHMKNGLWPVLSLGPGRGD